MEISFYPFNNKQLFFYLNKLYCPQHYMYTTCTEERVSNMNMKHENMKSPYKPHISKIVSTVHRSTGPQV